MIIGIGCDIIEIKRIEKSLQQDGFLMKYFTDREIELIEGRGVREIEVAAVNFCAKEAVVKAMGIGFGDIRPKDIEVLREESGAPYVVLYGKAKEELERRGGQKVLVSLSHSNGVAVGFVVVEGE